MRLSLFAWALFAAAPAVDDWDDWPQWRGPDRDGRWHEGGLVRELPDEIPLLWSAPIGSGYSAPTVAGGNVFVADRDEESESERVLAFDRASGEPLWKQAWSADYAGLDHPAGPRVPVQVFAGRAVALGAVGRLVVLDAASGELAWEKDLVAAYSVTGQTWGFGASPVFEAGLLIVPTWGEPEAALVAFDLESGEEAWRALSDRGNHASPIVVDQAGRRVLVLWAAERIVGVAPESGALLWQHAFVPKNQPIGIASAAVAGARLFFSSFYDGCLLLELDAEELRARELWRRRGPNERTTDGLHCLISTPIARGEHLYGVDSYGQLRCLALADGARVWEDVSVVERARWGTAHLVQNGEDVWILNDSGELILARLTPQGYREIDRGHLIDPTRSQLERREGVVWSHPAFAGRCVFARNDEVLVCASLAAP